MNLMLPKSYIHVDSLPEHLRFHYGDYPCAMSHLTLRENRKLKYMMYRLNEQEREAEREEMGGPILKRNGPHKSFFITELDGKLFVIVIDER